MAGAINFNVIQGDTFRRNATFRQKSDQTPVNLAGSTVSGKVRLKSGTEISLVCSVTDAALGKFQFELSASTTATLPEGVHRIEVQVVYSDATVQTLITGNIVVRGQVA